jgi:PAS domain S-box-containing protein
MKAVKAPIALQSRVVLGWKKLNAKTVQEHERGASLLDQRPALAKAGLLHLQIDGNLALRDQVRAGNVFGASTAGGAAYDRAAMKLPAGTPARELGFVFVIGPALGLIGFLASGAPVPNLGAVLVLVAAAWAVGGVLLSGRLDPLGPVAISVVLMFGTVALSLGILFRGGPPVSGLAFFYLWTTPFAFILLSRRQAAMHVVLVGLCFAGVIVLQQTMEAGHAPIRAVLGRWIYTVGTVVLVGAVVRRLALQGRTSDERFRRTFHDSPIGELIGDGAGRYVEVNEAFARIVGRPISAVVGHHHREMTHPDDVAATDLVRLTTTTERPTYDFRKRYLRPDGESRTVSVTYSALGASGDVGRQLFGHVLDITEQVEAAAVAVAQDAELAAEQGRHERLQEALAQLGQAALEDQEQIGLLQLACNLAVDALAVDNCGVVQLLADRSGLEIVAMAGLDPEPLRGAHFAFQDEAALHQFLDPAIRISEDGSSSRVILPLELRPRMAGGSASALITTGRRPFGRLSIAHGSRRHFGPDDVRFVRSAASILSTALARQKSDQRRRELLTRLVIAQDAERARIAGDIHDDSLQVIAAARLQVHRLRNALSGEAEARAHVVEDVLEDAAHRLRNLMFRLHPPVINVKGGLESALRELASRASDGRLSTTVDFTGDLDVDQHVRVLIYRTVQEALTNAVKHAAAKKAWVRVSRVESLVTIDVRDDGVGFDPAAERPAGHLGLVATRERIEDAGGTMRIDSGVGLGTTLAVELPLGRQR